jgi:hypothetical protein
MMNGTSGYSSASNSTTEISPITSYITGSEKARAASQISRVSGAS